MPTSDDLPKATRWAGVPAADRVAERRSLLLATALELLGTEGFSATSVRAICQSARLNPRYFYESFDDLDDLVVALYDQLVAELHAEVTTAVQAVGEDSRAVLRAVVETTVRFVDEDHRRARVLYVEALGNEKLNRRRLETGFSIAGYVQADSARRNTPASEQVGMLTGSILVGGFSELLLAWTDRVLEVDRDQLIEDATELFGAMSEAAAAIARRRR